MAAVAAAVGAADVGDGGVGIIVLRLEGGDERVLGLDGEGARARLLPEPDREFRGHEITSARGWSPAINLGRRCSRNDPEGSARWKLRRRIYSDALQEVALDLPVRIAGNAGQ